MSKLNVRFCPDLIADSAFVAPNATVLGDVSIGEHASIWFGVVARGDTESIVIGNESNVQDLSVLHADPGFPCKIGNRVTIGHSAVVHGAVVEDSVMIGMRAVILNGATIGHGSLIAAGTVVAEGMHVPPRSIVMGVPGRIRREVSDEHLERIAHAADHYVAAAEEYRNADQ